MKKIQLLFLLPLFATVLSCVTQPSNQSDKLQNTGNEVQSTNVGIWQLVWEEEFDADLEQWKVWESGAYNKEIQFYTGKQLMVEDGFLTITAQREATSGVAAPNDSNQKDFEYVSGRIESKYLVGPSDANGEREYRYMARLKLPKGEGMWPAFWSYGNPWPVEGEIDVLEGRGSEPSWFQSNIFFGYEVDKSLISDNYAVAEYDLDIDLTDDFHTYELIWKADTLEVKLDGKSLHTYHADAKNYIAELFGKKHRIVLNIAVGGWFIEERDSSKFVDQAKMLVDWVRVYKR